MPASDSPGCTGWNATGAGRMDVRVLRAMALDMHAWRASVARCRGADVDEILVRIDQAIAAITAEQAQILIDLVAPANWCVCVDASATR